LHKWLKYGLWGLLVVAVLAAAHVAFWQRYMVEKNYHQVELAVNYDEIGALVAQQGLTTEQG
jgi:predicted negative regulator of RcsB-dependent stress response